MSRWQTYFEELFPVEIDGAGLRNPAASAMSRLVGSGAYGGAWLVSCRVSNAVEDAALLLVDVEVGLGQRRPVHQIRDVERVAIVFTTSAALPAVYPTRDGFSSTVPHFNLAIEGRPRSLCLFDMPEEEAIRIATPLLLLQRVATWMRETAHGRLHGADQPLDPIFPHSGRAVVLPPEEGDGIYSSVFRASTSSEHLLAPIFLERVAAESAPAADGESKGFAGIVLVTPALAHAQLRVLPQTVAELVTAYRELGVDLVAQLQSVFWQWPSKGATEQLMQRRCLLVIRSPIERSPGVIGGEASKAFATICTTAKLAEKLEALGGAGGFTARLIGAPKVETADLADLGILPLDVYRPFDRTEARAASGLGRDSVEPVKVTLVGAGALGSQIALNAAKSGLGRWTVVDPDHLLPHNLARHGLGSQFLGTPKAKAIAWEISRLLGADSATAELDRIEAVDHQVLGGAGLVIDASASVPTARWLANCPGHTARTASVFLNPTGSDLVLLLEGQGREPRLDHLEMDYYWELANDPALQDHLNAGVPGIYPSGGCRHPSVRLPQFRVGALAAIAMKRLLWDSAGPDGLAEIWRMSEDGIARRSIRAARFEEVEVNGWTVAVSKDVLRAVSSARRSAGAAETGGILVGAWDRVRKRAYIVGHYDAPPDSISETHGFIRGAEGVHQSLESVENRTAKNMTYAGEWHTHPPGFRSRPSQDDRTLLRWIGDVLIYSDVPALMLIAGEDGIRLLLGTADHSVLLNWGGNRRAA